MIILRPKNISQFSWPYKNTYKGCRPARKSQDALRLLLRIYAKTAGLCIYSAFFFLAYITCISQLKLYPITQHRATTGLSLFSTSPVKQRITKDTQTLVLNLVLFRTIFVKDNNTLRLHAEPAKICTA